jgi:hypothetical protein
MMASANGAGGAAFASDSLALRFASRVLALQGWRCEERRKYPMDAFDDAWEHLIVTIVADAEKHADYLRRR